jgi:hypothetical protein
MQKIPGGETGLIRRTVTVQGTGDNARVIEKFEVDIELLKEMREHLKPAAQELGQW